MSLALWLVACLVALACYHCRHAFMSARQRCDHMSLTLVESTSQNHGRRGGRGPPWQYPHHVLYYSREVDIQERFIMAQEGYKLLFQQSLFHRTLDQEEEEAPLGNIPLCGMGFYWCKMCVRLDYYAQLWQLRDPMAFKFLASKLHTAALALPRPQLFLSSSRSQIKAYQMQQEEERGEMQFATAFYCCLGVFRQSFGLAAAFAFCTLSLAPSTLFSLQSQLLYQLASSSRPCICKNTVTFRFFAKKRIQNAHCKHFTVYLPGNSVKYCKNQ